MIHVLLVSGYSLGPHLPLQDHCRPGCQYCPCKSKRKALGTWKAAPFQKKGPGDLEAIFIFIASKISYNLNCNLPPLKWGLNVQAACQRLYWLFRILDGVRRKLEGEIRM